MGRVATGGGRSLGGEGGMTEGGKRKRMYLLVKYTFSKQGVNDARGGRGGELT